MMPGQLGHVLSSFQFSASYFTGKYLEAGVFDLVARGQLLQDGADG